jgi:hypothetical protein
MFSGSRKVGNLSPATSWREQIHFLERWIWKNFWRCRCPKNNNHLFELYILWVVFLCFYTEQKFYESVITNSAEYVNQFSLRPSLSLNEQAQIFPSFCFTSNPMDRVLLEADGCSTSQEFSAFYGTRKLITDFTRVRPRPCTEPHEAGPHPPALKITCRFTSDQVFK